MVNDELRKYTRKSGVKHYELAEALNIHETMLSKMLRHELEEDLLKKLLRLVDMIAENKKKSNNQSSRTMSPAMKNVLNSAVEEVLGNAERSVEQKKNKYKRKAESGNSKDNLADSANGLLEDEWYVELFGAGNEQQQ